MSFDRATFYTTLRRGTLFDHGLSQRQVTGTEAILDAWDKSGYADDRWLADALGTAYHETGRAMYPVREGGLGKGHPYGVKLADGQIAYGRGFVQLTWEGPAPRPMNYTKADNELGLKGALVANFDLALQPDIAAQILLRGMAEGWFTGFKLSDYLNDKLADYLHARRIVNGMDQAETIAGYALVFFAAITAGAHKAADTTSVVVAPATPGPAPQTAADALSAVLGPLQTIADTLGSVIAPAGSPPGTSAPPVAADANTGNVLMNPLLAISIIQQVMTYAPTIEHIISEVPDIVSKGEAAIAALEKLDLATAVTNIEAIVADLGISQAQLASVVSHATKTTPPAATTAAKTA